MHVRITESGTLTITGLTKEDISLIEFSVRETALCAESEDETNLFRMHVLADLLKRAIEELS